MAKKVVKRLTILNDKLTAEQAKKIISYAGTTMYPDTKHNRAIIAKALNDVLQKLHAERRAKSKK